MGKTDSPLLIARGRRLYLILATILIAGCVLSALAALILGEGGIRNSLTRVVVPLAQGGLVALCWNGERWIVRMTAAWYLLQAALGAFIVGNIAVSLAQITPPRAAGLWFATVFGLMGPNLVLCLLQLYAGLMMLFSRSLTAFFAYQARKGEIAAQLLE